MSYQHDNDSNPRLNRRAGVSLGAGECERVSSSGGLEEQIFLECSEEYRAPRTHSGGASAVAMTAGTGVVLIVGIAVAAVLGIGPGIVAFSLGMAIVLLANPWNWTQRAPRASRTQGSRWDSHANPRRRGRRPALRAPSRTPKTDQATAQ